MEPTPTAFVDALYRKVLQSVKASNGIPTEDEDYYFHKKFSNAFANHVTTQSTNIQKLVFMLTNSEEQKNKADKDDDDDDDDEDDDNKQELFDGPEPNAQITNFVDALLDEASKQLELVAQGNTMEQKAIPATSKLRPLENKPLSFEKKQANKATAATLGMPKEGNMPNNSRPHHSGAPKPQDLFEERIDNSMTPFVSKLREKVHALHDIPATEEEEDGDQSGDPRQHHPYFAEIRHLKYAEWQLEASADPYKKIPVEDATYLWVDTEETLLEMMNALSKPEHKVIAVDLEHHSYRSYLGIVCLMQISTATQDFLVDTIALRAKLQILNTIFCDPARVKVLHGSDMDILWLQRDLGLYIVNLFDTGQAARLLRYPRYSLAYLLKRHCSVDADKQYQLADWRIRPLEKNMIKYAREDTRYLLYIYDQMKAELLDHSDMTRASLLFETLQNSNKVCLQVYVKPVMKDDDCVALSEKLKGTVGIPVLSELQQRVFAELFYWRDRVAREEDESTGYVLPNHALMKITKHLPTKSDQLFRTCHPVPVLVRKHAHQITTMIASEKAKLAAEEAKAAEANAARIPGSQQVMPQRKKFDDDEDAVMQTPAFTSTSQSLEHVRWESGKRKAKYMDDSASALTNGLRLSFSLVSVGTVDADAVATLQKVDEIIANKVFTVAENDRANALQPHLLTSDISHATNTTSSSEIDSMPQSIAETYQMSNRSKRRKLPTEKDTKIPLAPAVSTDITSATQVKEHAEEFLKQIGADDKSKVKSDFQPFDYSAASAQISGAKFQLDATSKNGNSGNNKRKQQKQPLQGGYNPFVAVAGGARNEKSKNTSDKQPVKKMHHMPRSATFR